MARHTGCLSWDERGKEGDANDTGLQRSSVAFKGGVFPTTLYRQGTYHLRSSVGKQGNRPNDFFSQGDKKKKISVMISFKGQLEARVISLGLRGSVLME